MYMICLLLAALSAVGFQLHPDFLTSRWYWRRFLLYSSVAMMGVVPMTHWVLINGPSSDIVKVGEWAVVGVVEGRQHVVQ